MTTENEIKTSSEVFRAAVSIATSAPNVPDWFRGKHDDSLLAARELYFIIKNKRDITPWKFEEIRKKAGEIADDVIFNASRGFEFPLDDEFQFERQVQWTWYYAQKSLQASNIYFPN